jgi:hypothetical protein
MFGGFMLLGPLDQSLAKAGFLPALEEVGML